ncbi:MAG: hypothetical protein RMJ98_22290 [Myxococcales bacterium]|nr:hypothetical protein [Myxococcales bacterium]
MPDLLLRRFAFSLLCLIKQVTQLPQRFMEMVRDSQQGSIRFFFDFMQL